MPLLYIMKSGLSNDKIRELLSRFSNCKSIRFQQRHSVSSASLKLLQNSWSIERRNDVESLFIYQQFKPELLDLLKSCFPKIKKIYVNANGKGFNNNSNYHYYMKFLIPLIKQYSKSLIELDCDFDTMCDAVMVPPQFIYCLQTDMINLQTLIFGGITMDLTSKERNTEIFSIKSKDERIFTDREDMDHIHVMRMEEILLCPFCLPLNVNIDHVTELSMSWDLCSKCIDNQTCILMIKEQYPNLEKLALRLCLSSKNTSLKSLEHWIDIALSGNNIHELTVQIVLVRDLWNDNTLLAISAISKLIHKILDNHCHAKYKKITFRVSELDCGNAAYLYLFNGILSEWIKNIASNLNAKSRDILETYTYLFQIIIDHQLPDFIYVDPYHYKPMATKGIRQMFQNIMNIGEQEINLRFILLQSSPFISSPLIMNHSMHQQFYDSLIDKNITKQDYCRESYEWIIFNFNSDFIQKRNKQQLIFNHTESTILDSSSVDYRITPKTSINR